MIVQSGIYGIRCRATGFLYVGSSASTFDRLRTHRRHLRDGRHINWLLQAEWAKHGESQFEFFLIEAVPVLDLSAAEQRHMDAARAEGKSLNIASVAVNIHGKRAGKSSADWKLIDWRGKTDRQIAKELSLSPGCVGAHRPADCPSPSRRGKPRALFSAPLPVVDWCAVQWQQKTNVQIAREVGVSHSTVRRKRPISIPSPAASDDWRSNASSRGLARMSPERRLRWIRSMRERERNESSVQATRRGLMSWKTRRANQSREMTNE